MTDTASNGVRKMVTRIFSDGASVERAYEAATGFGYDKGNINVVMSDETRKRYFSEDRPIDTDLARKAAEGGELGGPKGGRIRILIPILAAVGTTVALSSIGLVVAGPIAAAIAATGLAAGLVGSCGLGYSGERLRQYEAEIHDGGILVGVKTRSAENARRLAERRLAIGGQHIDA